MAEPHLILQLAEIPLQGVDLQGELDRSIFDLKDGLARPLSPLRYHLKASTAEGQVVLQGRLEAEFELTCARTTKPFAHKIELDPYLESIEPENSEFLDLTDQLREDILLALPAYPRAPGSDDEDDLPLVVESQNETSGSETRRAEWDALDGLKTND